MIAVSQLIQQLAPLFLALTLTVALPGQVGTGKAQAITYPVVDTGQTTCYDADGAVITCPAEGAAFYGQDAQFAGNAFNYTDSGNGTISDSVTGLTWQQTPSSANLSWQQAVDTCDALTLANQSDWRIPSLKELFSISDFSQGWPYLDQTYFDLAGASVSKDEQYWSSNYYPGVTVEGGSQAAFGVNDGTGHIKAYPASVTGPMGKHVRCVRGDTYGANNFMDNSDGTITDQATGLMWSQTDSGSGLDWEQALAYAQSQNAANYLGHSDWRLPNVKELQSIVDYTRAPGATNPANDGPAIDPIFVTTGITNEAGAADYPYYWTSTSALFQAGGTYYYAWYVAFGRAVNGEGLDFHGAGAVRFDTKVEGGPAGEGGERYYNYVRLVRDAEPASVTAHMFHLPFIIRAGTAVANTYPIVDTDQGKCYDNSGEITCSQTSFAGQDVQYTGNTPSYTNNGDGAITDNVTGLVWQKSPDTNGDGNITATDKLSYANAATYCDNLSLAGANDWQLPDIKQLYSLIIFSGVDPSGYAGTDTSGLIPFIDTDYFDFAYGDTSAGERIIDSQYASSNLYVGNGEYLFGVNFADGRIKGYGLTLFGRDKTFMVACVRANSTYGVNAFSDNGDNTITDQATGLMWAKNDSGSDAPNGLNWEEALAYVKTQNAANYLGYSDWRLPNVKELQSIVDYSRSPDTTNSAAIDPLFNTTPITNEAGDIDYSFYWSGTTHANWTANPGSAGAYVSFGRAMGYMDSAWQDVHGAGAQRSDPKSGDPADWPTGNGPQGDAIRIYNAVRLVRGGDITATPDGDLTATRTGTVISNNASVQATTVGAAPGSQPVAPAGAQLDGAGGQMPDLAAAATKLDITEDALKAALGDPSQGPPDFAAAAQQLNVTPDKLMAALGATIGNHAPGNRPQRNNP